MGAAENRAVVERLWSAFNDRRWEAAAAELGDDVVCEWPHSGERFRGRDAVIAVNREHPDPWISVDVRRVVADGDLVVSEVAVAVKDSEPVFGASFFELANGKIVLMTEYWVAGGSQDPYPSRAGPSGPT